MVHFIWGMGNREWGMVAGLFVFLLDILDVLEMLLKSVLSVQSALKCLKLFTFTRCSSYRNSLDGTTRRPKIGIPIHIEQICKQWIDGQWWTWDLGGSPPLPYLVILIVPVPKFLKIIIKAIVPDNDRYRVQCIMDTVHQMSILDKDYFL
jgi:hypothetical protein